MKSKGNDGKLPNLVGTADNGFSSHMVRWIRPSDADLLRLIDYRQGMSSSCPTRDPNCLRTLNYIGIVLDRLFEKEKVRVAKQRFKIFAQKKISSLPKGLEVRIDYLLELEESQSRDTFIEINVYYVPTSLAYELGIRVQKRKRSKRKTFPDFGTATNQLGAFDSVNRSTSNSCEVHLPSTCASQIISEEPPRNLVQRTGKGSDDSLADSNPLDGMKNLTLTGNGKDEMAYNPCQPLPLKGLKLHSVNWTCWRKDHIFRNLPKGSVDEKAKFLSVHILSTIVGGKFNAKELHEACLANEHVKFGLGQIIKFHQLNLNIYKIFTKCLDKWTLIVHHKDNMKMNRREKRILKRQKLRVGPLKNEDGSPDMFGASSASEDDCARMNVAVIPAILSPASAKTQHKCEKLKSATKLANSIPGYAILSTISQIFKLGGVQFLLGSNRNVRGFMKFVKRYIILGGRRCELQLQSLMDYLSVDGIAWLPDSMPKVAKLSLLAKLSVWVLLEYLIPLLQSTFYVTEASSGKNQLAFYKRSSWIGVVESTKNNFETKGSLAKCDALEKISGTFRFLPKKSGGVRPICSFLLSHKPKPSLQKEMLGLLALIASKVAPHANTDSVAFHTGWKQFMRRWKSAGHTKLYFVRTDLADAYPSVSLDLLRKVVCNAVPEDKPLYLVKYKRRVRGQKREWFSFKEFVVEDPDVMPEFIRNRPWATFIKQTAHKFYPRTTLAAIMALLEPMTVQIKRHKFRFQQGLLQGSLISQQLCIIYYGHLESVYLKDFQTNQPEEFLFCVVDDYFYVTYRKERAELFLQQISKTNFLEGQPEAVMKWNAEKTCQNVNGFESSHDSVLFWGWEINLRSGHVKRDYSPYENSDMCASVTVFYSNQPCGNEMTFLEHRMKNLGPVRIQSIVLDPEINCERQIWRNLLDIGIIGGFRFYALARMTVSHPQNFFGTTAGTEGTFNIIYTFATMASKQCIKLQKQMEIRRRVKPLFNCEPDEFSNVSSCKLLRKAFRAPIQESDILDNQSPIMPEDTSPAAINEIIFKMIIMYGFMLKLKQHASSFSSVITKIIVKLRRLAANIGCKRTEELLECLPAELPVWFQRIRK